MSATLALATGSALAQEQELRFTFMGSDAGTNVYMLQPDGSFISKSELDLAGSKISSKLTGKFVGGKLSEWSLTETRGALVITVTAVSGKSTIEVGGSKRAGEYKPSAAVFANLHPALSASIAKAYVPSAAGSQKMDVLLVDGAATMPIDVGTRPARAVDVDGTRQVAQDYSVRFASVDMNVFVTEAGRVVGWNVPGQMLKAVAPGWEDLVGDPTTKMPELSQPTLKTVPAKAIRVKMRDGVELSLDMVRPDVDAKYPVILVRTPYGRAAQMAQADWYAKRSYVFIAQDVRGRGDSDGEWEPFVNERADGYDTIDWISKQPWCSGSVGMIGASYVGWVQWWAAVEHHPALKCIVPQVSPPDPFFNIPHDFGIPFLYGGVWWAAVVKDKGPLTGLPKLDKLESFRLLPITKVDDAILGKDVPYVDRWWTHQTASSYGSANFMADMKNVTIPALHISGWWDGDGIGTKLNWAAMRALKRTNQWLIYGPWTHAFNTTSRLGDVDYGPDAILELDSVYLRWFDTWLKGKAVGQDKVPHVRVFVTGANKWLDMSDWPEASSPRAALYLSANGPANGPDSVGELVDAAPAMQEPDRYAYNPALTEIPKDLTNQDASAASTQVKLEAKDQNQLFYKTAPLTKPVVMGGPVDIDLYITSSAVDTDFYAQIVDVDAKGVSRVIGKPAKLRARYHRSFDKPELLKPGRVYKLTLQHWDVAHQFAAGHRVGLLITSDGYPVYARNLGTGEPDATATRMVVQSNAIYHDAKHPSALRFRALTLK